MLVCRRTFLKLKLSLLLSSEECLLASVDNSAGNARLADELTVTLLLFSPAISLARSWNFLTKSTLFSSIMACKAVSAFAEQKGEKFIRDCLCSRWENSVSGTTGCRSHNNNNNNNNKKQTKTTKLIQKTNNDSNNKELLQLSISVSQWPLTLMLQS